MYYTNENIFKQSCDSDSQYTFNLFGIENESSRMVSHIYDNQ